MGWRLLTGVCLLALGLLLCLGLVFSLIDIQKFLFPLLLLLAAFLAILIFLSAMCWSRKPWRKEKKSKWQQKESEEGARCVQPGTDNAEMVMQSIRGIPYLIQAIQYSMEAWQYRDLMKEKGQGLLQTSIIHTAPACRSFLDTDSESENCCCSAANIPLAPSPLLVENRSMNEEQRLSIEAEPTDWQSRTDSQQFLSSKQLPVTSNHWLTSVQQQSWSNNQLRLQIDGMQTDIFPLSEATPAVSMLKRQLSSSSKIRADASKQSKYCMSNSSWSLASARQTEHKQHNEWKEGKSDSVKFVLSNDENQELDLDSQNWQQKANGLSKCDKERVHSNSQKEENNHCQSIPLHSLTAT